MIKKVKEIFEYKEMLKSLVRKDLRTRYKGSFLGFLWTFLNPLMQLLVYSLIFPHLVKVETKSYAMFLFVVLLPWGYFSGTLLGSCNCILANANLVTKIYFPRHILPLSNALAGLCNLFLAYVIVFPMLIIFGVPFTLNLLWLPLFFLVEAVMCMGFAMLISAINVYFRDLEHILSIFLMALYFSTPIMYGLDRLSGDKLATNIMLLNPMAGMSELFRGAAYNMDAHALNLGLLIYPVCFAVAIFFIGFLAFDKMQRNFAEIL